MIDKLQYFISKELRPYENMGVEAYLLENVPKNTCILYLWQNQRTVVIGKNQNCWSECRVKELEADGGFLARRLSGGGCVYHDDQNLNFTFLVNEEDYNVDRQLEVILKAVKKFGLNAQKTGRNDITIDGRKFSGNAFYKKDGKCYHHGTLLINTDAEAMGKYLNVSEKKLKSKGVSSVKSRVVNLKELQPDISVSELSKALIEAFSQVYGANPLEIRREQMEEQQITKFAELFSSWEWKYGKKIPFSHEMEERFPWGGIQLLLNVNEGVVQNVSIYSDAMDAAFIEELSKRLLNCRYQVAEFEQALGNGKNEEQKIIIEDIKHMIKSS